MILRRSRVFVLVVPLAVLVALAAPAAAGESKSDKPILKAGVITQGDVSAGWTSVKATSSGRGLRGISECKKINTATDNAKKNVPRARSRVFQEPTAVGTTSAESSVYAFKDLKAATKFVSNYQGSQAAACYEKAAAKTASSQRTAGSPTVSPITDLQGVGDEAVGYEIQVPFSAGGVTSSLYLDIIAVRVGRAVVGFNFSNLDARIADGPTIVQAVVIRVAEAQASA